MIAFTSFPVAPGHGSGAARRNLSAEEEYKMDLDEDFESGGLVLTVPGEALTSAQAYMRCVDNSVGVKQGAAILLER
jgi:exosome complex component RRP4